MKKKKKINWLLFWAITIPIFFTVNWLYHAFHKPAEVIGLFDRYFYKNPANAWQEHGSIFEEHATDIITPDFLAALAQSESQGNSIARTFWRFNFSTNPFEIYAPASSAVGLFQITDGTFNQLKKYCIQGSKPAHGDDCWFNFMYNRLVPSHATEMVSAYLHHNVVVLLTKYGLKNRVSLKQKQNLAAIIHLCGVNRGESFVRKGFRVSKQEYCGSHNARSYLKKLHRLKSFFSKIALR